MLVLSMRKVIVAGLLAAALGGGTLAHAQTTQNTTQNQSQCNNNTGGSGAGALAGGSIGAINVAVALPIGLQATCLVNVLGPNQGQAAQQSATP